MPIKDMATSTGTFGFIRYAMIHLDILLEKLTKMTEPLVPQSAFPSAKPYIPVYVYFSLLSHTTLVLMDFSLLDPAKESFAYTQSRP